MTAETHPPAGAEEKIERASPNVNPGAAIRTTVL